MFFIRRTDCKKGLLLAILVATLVSNAALAQSVSRAIPEGDPNGEADLRRPTARGILPRIRWSPAHRRIGTLDYVLTGIGVTATVVTRVIGPGEDGPRGGVWIDEETRDALRAEGYRSRLLAEDMSDVLLGVTSSYGLFGDPLVNAAWLRNSPDVGRQIFWINAEVMALTLGLQQATSNFTGRERPYGRTCGTAELDARTHACEGSDRYRSYFSGHTSVPFSIAAATCVNHLYLPLSGGKAWIPCVVGFAAAAASGTLRIVSDNHYATDVMTGVLVGTSVGLAVPLFHYAARVPTPKVSVGRMEIVLLPLIFTENRRAVMGLSIAGVLP